MIIQSRMRNMYDLAEISEQEARAIMGALRPSVTFKG